MTANDYWIPFLHPLASEAVFLEQQLAFIVAILIITAVALVVRRIKIPYTVALVLVGLALAFFPRLVEINVTSELILSLFVPPLIFEASLHLGWDKLKKSLLPILLMAAPGVLISTFIVGTIVNRLLGIPIAAAVAFGALISATDPVAVVVFFRSLGVSERLTVMVEGESLLNDGIAIVIFTLALGVFQTGESITLLSGLTDFLWVAFGGLAVGFTMAVLAGEILKRVDDHLIETTLTMALAFGAFVFAEMLHVSGILSVVAAGVYVGSFGVKSMTPTTKIALDNFWELLAFVANSIVFLLIGLQINVGGLLENGFWILIAVLAILVSRAFVVYLVGWLSTRLGNTIPIKHRHVMFWGGLRGAVSLALALSLTGPYAEQLRVMTFGVVLFTLLVQGITIEGVVKRLKLSQLSQNILEQTQLAKIFKARAGRREVDRLHQNGFLSQNIWQAVSAVSEEQIHAVLQEHPELEQKILIETRREILKSSRLAIADALRRNIISEEVYCQEIEDIDKRIAVWKIIEATFTSAGAASQQNTAQEGR